MDTVYGHYLRLRVLATWGLKRGLADFTAWRQSDADDVLHDVQQGRHRENGNGLTPGGVRQYVETLKLLRQCAPALPGGLRFMPWGARSAADVAGYRRPTENLRAPLPWRTWAPTIAAAWAFVDRFSEDIFAALRVVRDLPHAPRGPAGNNAWTILAAWAEQGGIVPLHTGFGRSPGERGKPNVSLLCRMLRINDSIFKSTNGSYRPAAVALLEDMAADPARSAYGGLITPSVTVRHDDGSSSPWIAEVGLGETEYLESVLRAACYMLLSSLTGMRDSEVQALTRRSATTRDDLPALISRQYKGQTDPVGTLRGWWAPAPVMRTLDILCRLSEHPTHLFARSASNVGDYDAYRDIPRLVAMINDPPQQRPGRGQGLGLTPIDTKTLSNINAATLRRSFSVYAVTKPGAELGLGIQLGHAAWRTTTGYASDGQQQAVRHMNSARVAVIREQALQLIRGTSPVAGTPAKQIIDFRAQVIADPSRADRIAESVADRLHLGLTNDCMFEAPTAGCGPDGPHLGDHLCIGAGCGNAFFRLAHLAVLTDGVARIDNFLDSRRGSPALRERTQRDRANLMKLIRSLRADGSVDEEDDD
ncbi:hypothetical protein ACL02O_24705 [Micromonospora sp. MS34]|uniref:hypothetical protein n=1 Tax=Micromonospora sp. MS34 TaxID=3385971 RepID=UPI0039A1093C